MSSVVHPPSGHRLLAILAADAADYSRLITQDEPLTVAALLAARGIFKDAPKPNVVE
jgi:hypothetical protein